MWEAQALSSGRTVAGGKQGPDFGQHSLAKAGLHHLDVRGVAEQVGAKVPAASGLAVESVHPTVVQDGAESSSHGARDRQAAVHDHASDSLLGRGAQDLALPDVFGKALLLTHLVDPPQEAPQVVLWSSPLANENVRSSA